ncbi:MAG TPA: Na/Pi cotransporter family protein [Candidatus Sulfotelmatobacter sp.]|nr:Na/Pi cotransporter family protein [Candidatus Sulfotelmatobacter sp.]
MTGTNIFLDLAGGIALLLWGMHMVQTGVVRAFGADLRRFLSSALRSRLRAFLVGAAVTGVLQSSTATGLMVASFSASGLIALVPALAVMLGANVGTTLIVQLLSFDVTWIAPILLVIGVALFKRSGRTRWRDLGRTAIGVGLMLLSLHILLDTLAPAEYAPSVQGVLKAVTGQPTLNVVIGALMAWLSHSSVAVVLLVMSLSYSGFITPVAVLALIVGANLGSAINPIVEGSDFANPATRRVPVGNLINRLVGCVLTVPFLPQIADAIEWLDPHPARQAADFHTLFNLALAGLFVVPLGAFARLLERLMPDQAKSPNPETPLYLDPGAVQSPSVALTCAARELLHMGDLVDAMLRQSMTALLTDDRKLVGQIERMDNAVDKLHEAIKLYVTQITRESLDEVNGRRAMEIIAFDINLEHIGDIIDKNLMELASKKIKNKLKFSDEGAAELTAFHRRVSDNLKLALGAFISGDAKIARQLLDEKVAVREAERDASEKHLARLRDGRVESIETSSLHLDVLRDLKRIHSHICSVAYPILETTGELQPSRLKSLDAEAETRTDPPGGLVGQQPR